MNAERQRVYLVVDRSFGQRLTALSSFPSGFVMTTDNFDECLVLGMGFAQVVLCLFVYS